MPRIASLQYLRAVAALLVVAYHSSIVIRRDYAPDFPMWRAGEFGVDIFFVISGFIMWTIAASRPTTPAAFFERRVIRIVPLYWALTILTAVVSTDNGLHFSWGADPQTLLRSFFFIPQWNERLGMAAPILFAGWTLNLEMFFYAVFALALFLEPKKRLAAAAAALFALASMRLFVGVSDHPAINLYTNSVVGEFAFGVLLGWFYGNGFARLAARTQAPAIGALLIFAGAAAVPFRADLTDARLLHFGIPALAVVVGALLLEKTLARRPLGALRFLGDASYSIYLAHIMAQAVSLKIVGPLLGNTAPALAVLAQTAFGAAAGSIVYILVEKPLTRGAAGLAARLRSAPAGALAVGVPLTSK